MTHSSFVSSVAARIGSAEFFEPLMLTEPESVRPPCTRILSISCENESVYTLIVLLALDFFIPEFAQVLTDCLGLLQADLQCDGTAGSQMLSCVRGELSQYLHPVCAAVERPLRIVLHLTLECWKRFRGDIRQVGHDEVVAFGNA